MLCFIVRLEMYEGRFHLCCINNVFLGKIDMRMADILLLIFALNYRYAI